MNNSLPLTSDDLPAKLPLMPLKDMVLLPGGYLPMTLVEPKDLALVEEALATKRLMGIVQPNPQHNDTGSPFFSVGCAGRIVNFIEAPHGAYQISLLGCCRFDLVGELKADAGFLRGVVRWDRFKQDLNRVSSRDLRLDGYRERLESTLQPYFRSMHLDIDLDSLKTLDHDRLIVTLAMICPFTPSERQELLEATDTEERSKSIMALIEMALIQDKESPYAKH